MAYYTVADLWIGERDLTRLQTKKHLVLQSHYLEKVKESYLVKAFFSIDENLRLIRGFR